MGFLAFSTIAHLRRSHALEHATIQLLHNRHPNVRFAGCSTPHGFYVCGDVSTESVERAATAALARLRGGSKHLAIHPQCGTNLVALGSLVGLVSFLIMLPGDDRSRRERFPMLLLFSTLTLLLAQPLGPLLQQYVTTDANVDGTEFARVQRYQVGRMPVHKVLLRHEAAE